MVDIYTLLQVMQLVKSNVFYLQTSVDSVEALIKKHSDFEGTSVAHEERTKALSDQANRLIHAGHYATTRCRETISHANRCPQTRLCVIVILLSTLYDV